MATEVCWGNAIEYDDGIQPSVAMNNSGVVVEVHEAKKLSSSTLRYRVGGQGKGNTIDWGSGHDYDSGTAPCVAINDSGVVVEVHKSQGDGTLSYLVGQVDFERKVIVWGPSHKYDKGMTPSVAINNTGRFVEVHKTGSNLYYFVGSVNALEKTVDFNESLKYDSGVSPSVALSEDGQVIEVHCSGGLKPRLWYRTGTLKDTQILFNTSVCYADGESPSVALNDQGQVVEVHKSQSHASLWCSYGALEGTTLSLGRSYAYENGSQPSVAATCIDTASTFVEVHKSVAKSSLWYHKTRLFPRGNYRTWMKDNYEALKTKSLYQITLPGTHDTGTYDLGEIPSPGNELPQFIKWVQQNMPFLSSGLIQDWSTAQSQDIEEQLKGGIRFLDLRIAQYQGDFYIHHGVLGPRLSTVFQQVYNFMSSVEWELVVISASHMENMDDSSHAQFMQLIEQSLGPFLYKNVGSSTFLATKLLDILQAGPKIIFIYDDSYLASNPSANFWSSDFIYDNYSNTNVIETLVSDQGSKLEQHSGSASKLFELQWILTPQTSDILSAFPLKLNPATSYAPTLHSMSQSANMRLESFISTHKEYQINIIIADFYQESQLIQQCIELSVS